MLNKRTYKLIKLFNSGETVKSETIIKNTENFEVIEYAVKFLQPTLKDTERMMMQTFIKGNLVESVGMEVY